MQVAIICGGILDGYAWPAFNRGSQDLTSLAQRVTDDHRTGPALAFATADARAGRAERVSETARERYSARTISQEHLDDADWRQRNAS